MAHLINIPLYSDKRGELYVIEKCLPFEIKRVFFIKNVSQYEKRGGHRHIKTNIGMMAVEGKCKVYCDNGNDKKTFDLKNASEFLILDAKDWHEMYEFTDDCILMVFASENYDQMDYINEPYD